MRRPREGDVVMLVPVEREVLPLQLSQSGHLAEVIEVEDDDVLVPYPVLVALTPRGLPNRHASGLNGKDFMRLAPDECYVVGRL